jgi:cell division inhibitor SepF
MSFVKSVKSFLGFEEASLEEQNSPARSFQQNYNPALKNNYQPAKTQTKESKVFAADFQALKKTLVKKNNEPAQGGPGIVITEPRTYEDDSRMISSCLKDGQVVIINLKYLDAATGKRLIDFICGTIYAFEGYVKKLGGNIFLCTPGSVNVFDNQQEEVMFNEQTELQNNAYNTAENVTQQNMFYQETA